MPQLDAFPYITVSESLIQKEDWILHGSDKERLAPSVLKEWDPLTDLSFSRSISIDFKNLFSHCGLSAGSAVGVVTSWYSMGTKLKEQSELITFPFGTQQQYVDIKLNVSGSKLAHSLYLLTRIVLRKCGRNDDKTAASEIGSILWEDEHFIRIEGSGSRFPMEFADFPEIGLPPNAGWRLSWKKEFGAQAMGNICLLINSKHTRLRAIVSGSNIDAQAHAILETIHFSVARDLIIGGLQNPEFMDNSQEFPRGSVGEVVRLLISRCFCDLDLFAVQQLFQNSPDRFDCHLQHALKLFYPSEAGNAS